MCPCGPNIYSKLAIVLFPKRSNCSRINWHQFDTIVIVIVCQKKKCLLLYSQWNSGYLTRINQGNYSKLCQTLNRFFMYKFEQLNLTIIASVQCTNQAPYILSATFFVELQLIWVNPFIPGCRQLLNFFQHWKIA